MKDYRRFLDPEAVVKLGNIEIIARMVVEGFITGLHRSPYHGFSVEFAEHSQYRPGDEIKYLDWKVYGRTNRYFIKKFEEETNLRCMIAVDSSASMGYSSGSKITKFAYASYLAASLAYLMIKQRDAVGISLYDKEINTFLPPKSKPSYIHEILKALGEAKPAHETGTSRALDILAERVKRRGLIIIISDFFDEPASVLKALKHFRHRNHEVIAFQILDPRELDFNFGPGANFVDVETGEEMATQPHQIRSSYVEAVKRFTELIRRESRAHNIDYNLLTTSTPFDKALKDYLVKRKKM